MTPERELLLKAIAEAGAPIGPGELAARLNKPGGAIRKMLSILKQAGQVEQASYGKWQAVTLDGNKTVTVSGNTSGKPVTLPGKVKGLSQAEQARIAYNLLQNKRNATPEGKARRREQNRIWRETNPDKVKACNKKWRKANPEKIKAWRLKHYAKKYQELIGKK